MSYINSKEIWASIDKGTGQEGWLAKLVPMVSAQNVYVALKSPEMTKTLLVEVSTSLIKDLKEFEGNGFKIFFLNIKDRENKTRLCIQLVDSEFEEVFFEITDLLLESIKNIKDEKTLVKRLLERISIYQSFFEKPRRGGFRINAQQGLFAELDFMQKKLFEVQGVAKSLSLWKAPDSGLHDFTGQGYSLEIKSTNQIPAQNVGVTSEYQLNDKRVNSLFLCITEINRDVPGGENLNEKIENVRKVIESREPEQLENFNALLGRYGYFKLNSKDYSTSFRVNLRFYYRVEGNFPRIVPTSLSEGVRRVGYQIDLNMCEEWKTDELSATKDLIGDISN